jgi:hypothetical protein
MLTLDVRLKLPAHVSFTLVEEDAILLNTQTNKYYALDEVGARLWGLLNEGKRLKEAYQILLDEYEVEPARLEKDLLELIDHLMENGLVEIAQG